ncbi:MULTISPECIES: hypothetical protein [unclassified Vibrio]|uniref:hypothetical protein n=1 Tax=unclassified Vibrio TaxID=2614977 RepID=UPI002369F4F6|nr:hypothetical protein [Vibrio europaeus]
MIASHELLSKTKLSAQELDNLLKELGYVNKKRNACAQTLASMLHISYRNSRRMLAVTGVSGIYYDHLLFQLDIKNPEFSIY